MAHGPVARGRGRAFIYAFRCCHTGNIVYVGQTTNPRQRWYELYCYGIGPDRKITNTYPQILECVRSENDEELRRIALKKEIRWIYRLERRGIRLLNEQKQIGRGNHVPPRIR